MYSVTLQQDYGESKEGTKEVATFRIIGNSPGPARLDWLDVIVFFIVFYCMSFNL
jgi:hypothetical protein